MWSVRSVVSRPRMLYLRLHNSYNNCSFFSRRESVDLGKTSKERQEAEFVSGAIIQAKSAAKASEEVGLKLCEHGRIICVMLEVGPKVLLQ